MGDKTRAKQELAAAGVELVPGTAGAASLAEVRSMAADLGYPVLLKAAAGGGGKGMRVVAAADELDAAFATASHEAEAAFGDGSLYLEQVIDPARHVEVQVLADAARRRPDPRRARVLDPAAAPEADRGVAVAGSHPRDAGGDGGGGRASSARRLGYLNAGTFEFLLGPDGRFYFIELNARLQVEHPVVRARDRHRHRARAAAHRRRRAVAR